MSNLSAHCRECFYEKTHTENDHPCSNCYGGDECLDKRIPELQAQVAKMRKALEEIARVRRGLDMTDTDEYRVDYFFRQVDCYQDLARKALRDTPPA